MTMMMFHDAILSGTMDHNVKWKIMYNVASDVSRSVQAF